MISVMMGLLAGVASQSAVLTPNAPPVVKMPAPLNAPLPALPHGTAPTTRATVNQPLPKLFSTADYPVAALRNEEQGTVSFTVAIDRTGRVTNCSITQSSGSASLDITTCSIVSRRARFSPALDAAGRAVEDSGVGKIRWVLPPLPFADRRTATVLTLNARGAVIQCRVEGTDEAPNKDLCRLKRSELRTVAAEAGRRIVVANRELVLETGMLVGGPDAARGVGHGSGEISFRLTAMPIEIDAAGAIKRCGTTNDTVDAAMAAELCKESSRVKIAALDSVASDQSTRYAVYYWATYTRPID